MDDDGEDVRVATRRHAFKDAPAEHTAALSHAGRDEDGGSIGDDGRQVQQRAPGSGVGLQDPGKQAASAAATSSMVPTSEKS